MSEVEAHLPFQFDPAKFGLIIVAAILASSLSELISYFLLYRKEDYRFNKSIGNIM